jgi:putative peptide zinc metalloprotease protein
MIAAWFTELNGALAQPENQGGEQPQCLWTSLAKEMDINNYQPQAHPQVIAREIEENTGHYFVLKNTQSKTYLRLLPEEYQLWLLMNGQKTVQELVVEHFVNCGAFARNMVIQLVHQLRANHMLLEEPKYVWASLGTELNKRSWGHKLALPARALLSQQLNIPGMDRIVTILYRSIGWLFFTRTIQALLILLALAGFLLFNWILANPNYVLFQQAQVSEILLFWAAAILPILIHELGHALTVKHYGREVNAGGLMLYFGLPAAYVDTTDIWLENRRARLNVTWNGPYTGLILGGICALIMWLAPALEFNSFLFKMASVAYLTVFINVNPLLKYDGYYILSDALGITFLRERSIRFIQDHFLRKILRREGFTRDEKIFGVFGVLSILWTAYALYLAIFFWQTRMSSGLQVLLGSNYNLLSRILSFLSMGALVSLVALLILQFLRFISTAVNQYVRGGGLQRHTQLALVGVVLATLLGFGLPRLFPSYQEWVFLGVGFGVPFVTAICLLNFNRAYYLSNRWWAQLAFSIMLFLLACVPLLAQFGSVSSPFEGFLFGAGIVFAIMGGIVFIQPAWSQIKMVQVVIGLLGAGLLIILEISLEIQNVVLFFIPWLALIAVLDWSGLRGGARAPALGLISFGVAASALSVNWKYADNGIWLFGVLVACAGVWLLMLARIPQLSRIEVPVSSNKRDAIGHSVAILVRRVIAQVFFESGWAGINTFGRDFSQQMKKLGLDLFISTNQFTDGELSKRQTFDLVEVYGLAFDKIYELLRNRFGHEYALLTIGRGIDLIPWQNREVVGELVLARREWGNSLNEASRDQRSKRIKLLDRVSLFINATYDDLRPIASVLKSRQYAAGETIIRQGEPGNEFFIVESGKVQVWVQNENLESQQVNSLSAGQFFGEAALVTNAPRNATIIAETPAILLSLGREDFDILVMHHHEFAKNIKANIQAKWILRHMPIFDELDAIELNYLASRLKTETFKAGEMVIRQGDIGDKFYIVNSGELRIFRDENGGTIELDHHTAGDYFGEIALMQRSPRMATVVTLTDVELFSLDAEAFMHMLGDFDIMRHSVERTTSRRLKAFL